MKNPKTVQELKEKAVIFWPAEICEQEKSTSVIPLLLESQEKFINFSDCTASYNDEEIKRLAGTIKKS